MDEKLLNLRVEKELPLSAAQTKLHIAELLRIGPGERYKNKDTKGDFVVYPEDDANKGKIFFFNKPMDAMKLLGKTLNERILSVKDFDTFGRKLLIQRMDKDDTSFKEEDVNFGRMLYEAMYVANGIFPICVVGHQDQGDMYLHWHMIYVNKTDKDFGQVLLNGNEIKNN